MSVVSVPYDRARLVRVLIDHQRHTPAACLCGWSKLGASHPEHVADMYEAGRSVQPDDAGRALAKARGVLDGLEVNVGESLRVARLWLERAEGCGGCHGLGSHRRWCPVVVGATAARIGQMGDDLDDLGDILPPALANAAWVLGAQLRFLAEQREPGGASQLAGDGQVP